MTDASQHARILTASLPHSGFTLIELIIYIALAAITLVIVVDLNLNLIRQSARSETREDVERDMQLAMRRVTQEIHAARDIDTGQSTFSSNPGKLTLNSFAPAMTPTIIDVFDDGSGQRLRLRQGTSPVITSYLTGHKVKIDNFTVRNVSDTAGTPRTRNVQIELHLQHINPDALPEWNYSAVATTSVELMNYPASGNVNP